MKKKRMTKEERKQFLQILSKIGVSENVFRNWKSQRTEIPKTINDNYFNDLKKFLHNGK